MRGLLRLARDAAIRIGIPTTNPTQVSEIAVPAMIAAGRAQDAWTRMPANASSEAANKKRTTAVNKMSPALMKPLLRPSKPKNEKRALIIPVAANATSRRTRKPKVGFASTGAWVWTG